MLAALSDRLGVDYVQWKALVRNSLRLDFRVGGNLGISDQRQKPGSSRHLVSMVIFYLFSGIFFAVFILFNKQVSLTSTIFAGYVMFMIGSIVLIEYNAVVISPDDYAILGYRPVSSRTFFAARLANVFFYVALMTSAIVIIPGGAYFFTLGFRPLLGLTALTAFYSAAFSTALFMIVLYTAILRYVHPRRLKRVLSYMQLLTSFVIYGSYIFLPRLMKSGAGFLEFSVSDRGWLLVLPPTWYASYLQLALGNWQLNTVVPAVGTVALVMFLLAFSGRNLSLSYSERLAALAATSDEGRQSERPHGPGLSRVFRSGEGRGVALLIRNQFRYDMKFRLSVLGILPLTVFYLVMALMEGPLPDPLVAGQKAFQNSILVYLAVLLFPLMLKGNLSTSDHFQASWIFFASPARLDRLVLATKNVVLVYFLAPYLVMVGLLFAYFYAAIWHAAVHIAVLGMLAHLSLQISVLISPELPFSRPSKKGERSARIILTMMILPVVVLGLISILTAFVYPRPSLTLLVVAALLLLTVLTERLLIARLGARLARSEYRG